MINALLALSFANVVKTEWVCPKQARLIYRTDGGVAYACGNEVVPLSTTGKREKSVRWHVGQMPLFYGKDTGLVTASIPLIVAQGERDESFPNQVAFAEGDHVFIGGQEATFLGKGTTYTLPGYGPFSAVAANRGSTVLAMLRPGPDLWWLKTWKRAASGWTEGPDAVVPYVEGVGACSILPRFNDLTFLSGDFVAYVGVLQKADQARYPSWASALPDLTNRPLEEASSKPGTCFLFATRVCDGATYGLAKLRYRASGEFGGPTVGRMTLSSDSKTLFLMTEGRILILGIPALLKQCVPSTATLVREVDEGSAVPILADLAPGHAQILDQIKALEETLGTAV